MTAITEARDRLRIVNSSVITAFATGLYVCAFYISGNITMLSSASVVVVVLVLTIPITTVVLLSNLALSALNRESYAGFLSMFICGLYLLVALRAPVFESQFIREFRGQLHGIAWVVANVLYFVVPAVLIGVIFRENAKKLTIVLVTMSIGAVFLGFLAAPEDVPTKTETLIRSEQASLNINLKHKPNIYFILSDGFASFSYMAENGIDTSVFRGKLLEKGFRLYDDTYSNYHATLDSMLSMLDMRHHYYGSSGKLSEIIKSGRIVVGGENNFLRLLKHNGYGTQYVHQSNYLLLQGCSADYCFPSDDPFSGARNILRELAPSFMLQKKNRWEMSTLGVIGEEIIERIEVGKKSLVPQFHYIQIFEPGHTRNEVVGICDEVAELALYSKSIAKVSISIESIVDDIIRLDPRAVVVISGDHGPFITNKCRRHADLNSLSEYRDRVGVVTAIRWPDDYDGQYDQNIMTNVNLFRYLLASMVDDSGEILGALVPEDVFVYGGSGVLKIISKGNVLIPPEKYSMEEMRKLYIQDLLE